MDVPPEDIIEVRLLLSCKGGHVIADTTTAARSEPRADRMELKAKA